MLDEPTSALDMSVQAQVVDLLRDLQAEHDLAYLFISHDLKVVRALANDIIVMRDGKVVEHGPAQQIFEQPRTDYTKALISAAFKHRDRSHCRSQPIGLSPSAGLALASVSWPRSSDRRWTKAASCLP